MATSTRSNIVVATPVGRSDSFQMLGHLIASDNENAEEDEDNEEEGSNSTSDSEEEEDSSTVMASNGSCGTKRTRGGHSKASGKSKVYAALDGDADKPGDRSVIKDMDPMQVFAYNMVHRAATRPKSLNYQIHLKMLFDLCCGLAGAHVDSGEAARKFELYLSVTQAFGDVISQWPKATTSYDRLFKYLPGNKWPDEFINTFLPPLQHPAAYTGKFQRDFHNQIEALKERVTEPIAQRKLLDEHWFGSVVWDNFKESLLYVNNYCNKLYPSGPLPSGITKGSKLLEIREQLIAATLDMKTTASLTNAAKYRGVKVIDLCNEDASLASKKLAVNSEKFNLRWYPRSWLCFVLLGKPAETAALPRYNSMSVPEQYKGKHGAKPVVKVEAKSAGGSGAAPLISSSHALQNRLHTVIVEPVKLDAVTKLEKRIDNMKLRLSLGADCKEDLLLLTAEYEELLKADTS